MSARQQIKTIGFTILLVSSIAYPSSIALKNFREIYESMKIVTGVVPSQSLYDLYQSVKDSLPKAGGVEEYNTLMQLDVSLLGGTFCREMITKDAAQTNPTLRWAHKDVDFAQPASGLTSVIRHSVIGEYAALFWQREATAEELNVLDTAMATLASQLGAGTDSTIDMLVANCATQINTIDFLTIR